MARTRRITFGSWTSDAHGDDIDLRVTVEFDGDGEHEILSATDDDGRDWADALDAKTLDRIDLAAEDALRDADDAARERAAALAEDLYIDRRRGL